MPEAGSPSVVETGAPPTVEAQKAERARVVQRVVAAKAAEGHEQPASTRADQALREYDKIVNFKDGQNIKYPKATADGDKDLLLPGFDTTDDQGQTVSFKTGEWRVAEITGVDADGNLQCVIENTKGETAQAPVPKEWALDGQLKAQEKDFEDAFADDPTAQKFIKDHIASLPQSGDNPPDGEFPDTATIKALEAKYATPTAIDDELQKMANEKTPREQIDATIAEHVTKLEEKGKSEKLSDDELKLLGALRLAQETNGDVGIAFKVDALRQLGKTGIDVSTQIAAVDKDVKNAEDILTQMVLDAGVSKEQFDKWVEISQEDGGMLLLLQDPDFDKLMTKKEAEISKAIFGKEIDPKGLKELLKGTKLPPELEKALESGDHISLLKVLLLVAAGIVAAPVLAVSGAGLSAAALAPKLLDPTPAH